MVGAVLVLIQSRTTVKDKNHRCPFILAQCSVVLYITDNQIFHTDTIHDYKAVIQEL